MMQSQSSKASEVGHGGRHGRRRQQSRSPPLTQSNRYQRSASSCGTTPAPQLELFHASPSTPPEDRVLHANMERLFEVYRRYERSRSRQTAKWTPPLSGDNLERRLVAEFNRVTEDDVRNEKQQRCQPKTTTPATYCDSKTAGHHPTRKGQSAYSKPFTTSREAAPKKSAAPALPTTTAKSGPHRPEAVRGTAETDSATSANSNLMDFKPPCRNSNRTLLPKLSAVGDGGRGTQNPQPSCQSSVTTTRMFQTDSCRPRTRQPVSTHLSSGSATCVSGRQQKIIEGGSNTSTSAVIQSRSVSVDRALLTGQRSAQALELTIFDREEIPTNRGSSRPRGDATSRMTSAQRLTRHASRGPRPTRRADATPTRKTSDARRSCYDSLGRGSSGGDVATTPARRLLSPNHAKPLLTTAAGVYNDNVT